VEIGSMIISWPIASDLFGPLRAERRPACAQLADAGFDGTAEPFRRGHRVIVAGDAEAHVAPS
jgi:hypothetical protein